MKGLSFFMVYMFLFPVGRTISGCHLNPIISFAMFFIKKIDIIEMVGYIIAQILAAVASSLFLKTFKESSDNKQYDTYFDIGFIQYAGLETVSACLFVLASLYASKKEVGSFVGSILIGGTSFVSIAGTHNFTMNALNPAVTLSLNFMNGQFAETP